MRLRLDEIVMDVRFALRQVRHAPGFAAVVVATLALGVGVNSAVFALADAALLRPLPFREPDRLVMVWERRGNGFTTMASPAESRAWSARVRSLDLAGMAGGSLTMAGADGLAMLVPSQTVTRPFFDVLGVGPLAGRLFQDVDVSPSPSAVLISEGLWRRQFGADPDAIGRSLVLGGQPMTVIGVVPAHGRIVPPTNAGSTATSEAPEVWTLAGSGGSGADRAHYLHVIGRLRDRVPIGTAQAELDAIARELARQSPSTNAGHDVLVQPLREALIGSEVRLTSLVLLGVVGFVLLMCCANLANLLLARTTARARELAVRAAIGATRWRIVAQLLTESVALAVLGGVSGAVLAAGLLRIAAWAVPPGLLPNALSLSFDSRVALFCAVASLIVGVAFGLAPAWSATGSSLTHATSGSGRSTRRGLSLSGALIAAEVAAAVLVVSGSGLLLRSWWALGQVDSGSHATELFTATVNLPFPVPGSRYPDAAAIRRFQADVERALARQPQVRRLAWGSALPLDGGWFAQTFRVAGQPPRPDGLADAASYHMVSAGYFETLGIEIVRGRGFSAGDGAAGVPVCIVSEAFVRRYLDGRDPVGVRIEMPTMAFGPPQPRTWEVVGVVRQVKGSPGEAVPVPQLYVSVEQNAWWSSSLSVEPRQGGAEALAPVVRAAMASVDRDVALRLPRTIERIASDATARPRFRSLVVAGFAALSLVLAMVGIFGVLAHAVGQRTRELGVRLALGARPLQVVALVAGYVLRSVSIGAVTGLVLATLLARSIAAFLFGVTPFDPVTFAGALAVLFATAMGAAAVPALRAVRVDPSVTFRSE